MNKENIESILPLLPMQQSFLWHSLNPRSGSGVIQLRCTLTGTINTDKLQAAWDKVVSQHQALRSTVHWEAVSKPMQLVHKHLHARISFIHGATDTTLEHYLATDENTALELSRGPAYRLALFHCQEDRYQLVWSLSHVILDGWSCALIINDWIEQYTALLDDIAINAQASPPIKEYTRWMNSQDREALLHFWNTCLPDDKGLTSQEITTKYPASTEQPTTESVSARVGRDAFTVLQDSLRQSGLGLGTLLQAALAVAIRPQCGNGTVLFSTTVSGRHIDLSHAEEHVGMLINVMPVCVPFQGSATVLDWLKGIQTRFFSSLPHSHVSASDIQACRTSHCSAYDTLLVLENQPSVTSSDKIQISEFKSGIISDVSNTLIVIPGEELRLEWQCRGRHATTTSMELTLKRIVTLLNQIPTLLCEPLSALDHYVQTGVDLPALENINAAKDQSVTTDAPGTSLPPKRVLERVLADIWREVLNLKQIDINADFFDLGGSSFQALQMFEKIERQLEVKLPATSLFNAPTVVKLAALLESDQPDSWWNSVVEVNRSGSKPPLFIPFDQTDMLMYRHLCRELGPEQPVYGIRFALGLPLTLETQNGCIDELVSHIKRIQPRGPYLLAGLSGAGFVAWEVAQKLQQEQQTVAMLALLDTYGPAYPDLLPPAHRFLSVACFLSSQTLQVSGKRAVRCWQVIRLKMNSQNLKATSERGNTTPAINQPNLDYRKRIDKDRRWARQFVKEVSKDKPKVTQWLNYSVLSMTTWRIRSFTPRMAFIVFTQGLLLEYCREQLSALGIESSTKAELHSNLVDGSLTIDECMPATRQQLDRYQRMYKPLKPYSGNVVYCKASQQQPGVMDDKLAGWDALLLRTPTIHSIPGSHTAILEYPHVQALSNTLRKEMERAMESDGHQ